ncbi:PAS domain S-box protein [Zavarzinella formosa]|uniref:PAS domain S-box protein n=1 Tax=Zavarzinella formosa TaxID=360055 RepID=UPI00031A10F0|nr:PAS domain S-box protein [Zavarzinella formosa]
MPKPAKSWLLRYGCAVVSVVLATVARMLLDGVLGLQIPFATYFFAIMFTAWFGGFHPAMLAVTLAAPTAMYFFILPRGTFRVDGWEEITGVIIFLSTGFGIAMLGGAMDFARQRAEASAEKQRRQAALVDQTDDAMLTWEWEGGISLWNRGAERLYGYLRSEAKGRISHELMKTKNRGGVAVITNTLAKEGFWEGELEHTTRDGRQIIVESRMVLVRDAARPYVLETNRDITESKQSQEEIIRSRAMLKLVLDNIPQGVFWKDRDSRYLGCNLVVAKAMGLAKPEDIAGCSNEDLSSITPEQSAQFIRKDREVMESDKPRFDIIEQMSLSDGRTIWLNTNKVPMHDEQGTVIGILGTWQDITESKRAEEARRASEELFRNAFDHTNVAMVLTDISHQFVRVNAAFARMFGYTEQEMLSLSMPAITHPDDLAESHARREPLLAGESQSFEMQKRYIHKDGRVLWALTSVSLMRDENGRPVRYVGQVQDITERKRAEEGLRFSERRFRAMLEHGTDSISLIDADNNILYLSPSVAAVEGYTAEELAGRNGIENTHPDDIPLVRQVVGQLMDNPGRPVPVTWRRRHKDGRWLWLEGVATNLLHDPAVGGIVTNYRDVTERKRAEEETHRTQSILAQAGQLARLGAWEYDFRRRDNSNTGTLWWSDEVYRLLGYVPGEVVPTNDLLFERVHPDDREKIVEVAQRSISERHPYEVEHRIIRADNGETRVLAGRAEIFFDPAGQPLRMTGAVQDITERKRAEEELRASELRYQRTLDEMLEGCQIIGYDWRYVYVNDMTVRHGRKSREELVGKTLMEAYPGIENTEVFAVIGRCMKERSSAQMENLFAYADGSSAWFELSIQPSPDGVFILTIDISARKLAERELERQRTELQLILDTVPALIFFKDRAHRIIRVNQELVRLVGFPREAIEGKTDAEVGSPHAARYIADEEEIMATGRSMRSKLEPLETAAGTRWLETEKVPYRDETGQIVGVVGLSVDVTERKHAESEILRLNAELEERVRLRTEELEAANKELEAFSYSVSHDLRAPLRAIDGFSRIVVEDYGPQLPPEAQEYLQDVRSNTQQMGRLVDDLLAFSRLSRQPVRKETFSTLDLVRRCLDELQSSIQARRVEFNLGDLPPCHGDASLLKQVWMNLLANALKYSGKRDPALIEVGFRSEAGAAAYFVRDNGVGFDMRYVHKLFGVFQRLHRSEDYEGTGVGLAIVQRIIHRHGGRVWAEAEPDRGATFFFTLPSPGESHHG